MSMLTEEVSKQKMLETIHYMTENFPYRLAGSPCEAAASRYVTERLRQYGLEVENKEFYTYNSDPMYSKVTAHLFLVSVLKSPFQILRCKGLCESRLHFPCRFCFHPYLLLIKSLSVRPFGTRISV